MSFLTSLMLENEGIPSPESGSFTVGPVQIHFYALFILLGIALALLLGSSRLKKRGADGGLVLDIALWAVPFGIIGGRIFHVLTHTSDYFGPGKDILEVLYVWKGGLAIYGALIFGLLGAAIGARLAGLRLMSFLDVIAPGVLLAQGIGRWGNYFNQELFGLPTDLPWGLQIALPNSAIPADMPLGTLFHPVFFYEFLWNIAGVVILLILDKRLDLRWGRLFALYLVYYSAGRFWIEGLRMDPSDVFFGLRTNQWSAVFAILLGLAIFLYQRRNHVGKEISVYLPGKEPKPEESEPAK
jgi:prolipoprotein diacylglyceryl transferase